MIFDNYMQKTLLWGYHKGCELYLEAIKSTVNTSLDKVSLSLVSPQPKAASPIKDKIKGWIMAQVFASIAHMTFKGPEIPEVVTQAMAKIYSLIGGASINQLYKDSSSDWLKFVGIESLAHVAGHLAQVSMMPESLESPVEDKVSAYLSYAVVNSATKAGLSLAWRAYERKSNQLKSPSH